MPENTIVVRHPRERVAAVDQLVRRLRPLRNGHPRQSPVTSLLLPRGRELAIVVNEIRRGEDHRAWFFSTAKKEILAQYFEYWHSNESETEWRLGQACLQIFWDKGQFESPEELFALHCEPKEIDGAYHSELKRGPHIHVKIAGSPLDRAHFPLNFGHLNDVLVTLQTLTTALTHAIEVVRTEVVDAAWNG